MDIFEHFSAVVAILEESVKLLPKNGKLMAFIALLSSLLYSSLFLVFNFSTMSLLSDMFVKSIAFASSAPANPFESSAPAKPFESFALANPFDSIMEDFRLVLLVDLLFCFGFFLLSLFITITTVVLSAASYSSKTLSGKDLVLQVAKSWIRPFISSFYTALLTAGYLCVLMVIVAPLLMFSGTLMLPIGIVVGVAAHIFLLYLNVDWLLSLVVSVMEENNYGITALGKAGVLIKEKRLQGFILNISLSLFSWILFLGFKIIVGKKGKASQTAVWIYVSIISCLVNILRLVAYTVLYFHCKKDRGEEMELQGSVSYKKLSNEPPFSNAA